jgi:hypothetical protein
MTAPVLERLPEGVDADAARDREPVPAPGFHDLVALTRGGHAHVEGDLRPLMANLRYVKDVLTLPRGSEEIRAKG